ncbi:hypothetical protein [Corynebacterium qintianiae]|uniref:hypothetical protein n=1 Tax=Corynebacterium qintianiae TaxID=2709392 RepID=UPI0013ECA1A6|nr:hypothetical protein [Corynebacterium qintianiae]
MEHPLHVDPEAVRERLTVAIAQYEEVISQLRAAPPALPIDAVGSGFPDSGRALAEALEGMQSLNVQFLENRVDGWRQVMRLMDTVEQADGVNASGLGLL